MLNKYYQFNVDAFFRDYDYNSRRYKEIRENMDDDADLDGISFGRIKGGKIADPTALKAMKREAKEYRIKELDLYFAAYDFIVTQLDSDELKVLDYIKAERWRKDDKSAALSRLCEALFCEKSQAYRRIDAFRLKVRQIVGKGVKMGDSSSI